jgi:hypothetical protein
MERRHTFADFGVETQGVEELCSTSARCVSAGGISTECDGRLHTVCYRLYRSHARDSRLMARFEVSNLCTSCPRLASLEKID